MIYVIFTYAHDAAALDQCLRAISAVDDSAGFCIFDDSQNPLPSIPAGVVYSKTYFPRQRNLNGITCVAGELRCFLAAMDYFGTDVITKIDADTILLRPVIVPNDTQYLGWEGQYWGYGTGACYAIRRQVVEASLGYIRSRAWPTTKNKFPEDETIGRLAIMHTQNYTLYTSTFDACRGLGNPTPDHLNELAEWAGEPGTMFIHFGQSIRAATSRETRQLVADVMRLFLDSILVPQPILPMPTS